MKPLFIVTSFLFTISGFSQTIDILTNSPKISLCGLSVVTNNILWASGSNGTVARSTDGGTTFQWQTVKGYKKRDFRDVEAFDSNTAIIMAIAEPAVILKTKDGGKTWKKVFEDTTKGMFLDAMDFYVDDKTGIVLGDPINGKVYIATTNDGGDHWKNIEKGSQWLSKDIDRSVDSGEAMFAASGTNVKIQSTMSFIDIRYPVWITGGRKSVLFANEKLQLPVLQGKEPQGANSIAAYGNRNYVIVGGDFTNDKDTTGNCVMVSLTDSLQLKFTHPQTPPHGYRSCVEYINENKLITCGTSGVDISNDGGMNWRLISSESFHVCQKAKSGNAVFLAGRDGRIAKLTENS